MVAALLALALVVAGVLTVTNLRGQLVAQVDDQLTSAVSDQRAFNQLLGELSDGRDPFGSDALPTRYVVQVWVDGEPVSDEPLHDPRQDALPQLDRAHPRPGRRRAAASSAPSPAPTAPAGARRRSR